MTPTGDTYQINEIFHSIQGEGHWMGKMATFVRLQGCTVGCEWCDTKYTWKKGGIRMSLEDIGGAVKFNHVIITGGEPTLYNLDPLISRLRHDGNYVQVETSGQQWFKGGLLPDWITWSPKETLGWEAPQGFYQLADEVKWVVDGKLPIRRVLDVWHKLYDYRFETDMPWFYFMPEGCPPRKEMADLAMDWLELRDYPEWRYSDRLQWRLGVK